MAKATKSQKMPGWVAQMGMLTDGTQTWTDPETGEIHSFPVGYEIADPKPMAIPAGMRVPPSLKEQMDELFRVGKLREAANRDETVDEANDFDIDDYFAQGDNLTPWQVEYDPLLGREISAAEFHEKFKSGELLEELKARWSTLEQQEDLENIVSRLEAAYQEGRNPQLKPAPGSAPASSAVPPAKPDEKSSAK